MTVFLASIYGLRSTGAQADEARAGSVTGVAAQSRPKGGRTPQSQTARFPVEYQSETRTLATESLFSNRPSDPYILLCTNEAMCRIIGLFRAGWTEFHA